LVGTASGFRDYRHAEPPLFSGLSQPSGRKITEIVVQLRKSG